MSGKYSHPCSASCFPRNPVERAGAGAERRRSLFVRDLQEQATQRGTTCQMGGPEREHQETIKFGGWSASRGYVLGGGAALVYIEIKAEK